MWCHHLLALLFHLQTPTQQNSLSQTLRLTPTLTYGSHMLSLHVLQSLTCGGPPHVLLLYSRCWALSFDRSVGFRWENGSDWLLCTLEAPEEHAEKEIKRSKRETHTTIEHLLPLLDSSLRGYLNA